MDTIKWAENRLAFIRAEEHKLQRFLEMAYDLRQQQEAELSAERTRSKQQEIEQTVVKLLKEAGRTLTTQEILQLLGNEGHELSGKDPKNTLAARLSNSKLVNYHQDLGGWWLTDSPVPFSTPREIPTVPLKRPVAPSHYERREDPRRVPKRS